MNTVRRSAAAALALVALAVAPSVASASIYAEEYPATLNGEGNELLMGYNGEAKHSCSPTFGLEATLEESASSLQTSSVEDPGNCTITSYFKMNGCQFELEPAAGVVRVGSSECGPVTFRISGCHPFEIPAGTEIDAEYRSHGSGSEAGFDLIVDSYEVEYVGDGYCKSEELHNDGVLITEVGISGANSEGESIGVVTGGVHFDSIWGQAQLESAEYPVSIVGERSEVPTSGVTKLLQPNENGAITCESAAYAGEELTEAAWELGELTASFSECKYGKWEVVVSMNSCRYNFPAAFYGEGDSEYLTGESEIACDQGDAITLDLQNGSEETFCTVEIPEQYLGSAVAHDFLTHDGEAGLALEAGSQSVEYRGVDFACGLVGIAESGTGSTELDIWLQAE